MKLEPGYFITYGGSLVRILMDDGDGQWIGALYEEAEDLTPARWEPFKWRSGGYFLPDAAIRRSSLDLIERINSSPCAVSYARHFDYCASYENDEPDDDGNMRQGFGATELEAVMDLLQAYPGEERAEHMRDPKGSSTEHLWATTERRT